MYKETYFWFLQPSSILNNYDFWFIYIFGGLLLAGVIFLVATMFIKHPIFKQALKRWTKMFLILGISGMVWAGFRYENTPIFAKRFWAGLLVVAAVIWLGFILKYMFFSFNKDRSHYEASLVKNKYLPKAKK